MNTVDALRKTKENLLMEGWCKGAYVGSNPKHAKHWEVGQDECGTPHCLIGHLRVVCGLWPTDPLGTTPTFSAALEALNAALPAAAPEPWCHAWERPAEGFSEHDDTTLADVCALIDRAISHLFRSDLQAHLELFAEAAALPGDGK